MQPGDAVGSHGYRLEINRVLFGRNDSILEGLSGYYKLVGSGSLP